MMHSIQFYTHRAPHRCALAAALALLSACQASPPPGPQGSLSVLPAREARLTLAVPDLAGASRHVLFRSVDGRYVEETAHWDGESSDKPRAGLRLSESSNGPPMTDPRDATDIIPSWTPLQDKRPAFAKAESTQNDLGPASWWRAGVGTSVCVLFLQRLQRPAPAAATLSGFYCNPPGLPLSPQAAVTVVRSIGLRSRPEGQ
jgi:hypothetical protein